MVSRRLRTSCCFVLSTNYSRCRIRSRALRSQSSSRSLRSDREISTHRTAGIGTCVASERWIWRGQPTDKSFLGNTRDRRAGASGRLWWRRVERSQSSPEPARQPPTSGAATPPPTHAHPPPPPPPRPAPPPAPPPPPPPPPPPAPTPAAAAATTTAAAAAT